MENESTKAEQANLSDADLDELATQVKRIFAVKDRTYGFPARAYPEVFVGAEAVSAMIRAGIAADEHHAVKIGNLLLQAGIFRHVLNEHPFRNEPLFYRFMTDGDHGEVARHADGSEVSWADFLSPHGEDHGMPVLQPRIPPRDPNLSAFAQDDLEVIGVSPLDEHNAALLDHVHPRSWVDPQPSRSTPWRASH